MCFRLAVLWLCCCLALSAAVDDGWYHDERQLWAGIPITLRFTPGDEALGDRVWAYLQSIDQTFNDWRDDSDIGRINRAGPGTYALNADLAAAFALAGRMRGQTGGACEITVGPLRRLWRQAEKTATWPGEAEIAQVMTGIGAGGYRVDGASLTVLKPGVQFDFGGVCKGFAVDRAAEMLRTAGCTAALVQIGGETQVWGQAPAKRTHRLGIPHPDAPDERMWTRIQDPGAGLCGSTSGNYRNPVVVAGKVLYHIYDPRTGQPTDTHVLSASVAFRGQGRNGEADCLTKAMVVLGEPGVALVAKAGAEALLLIRATDQSITIHKTPGWDALAVPEEAAK